MFTSFSTALSALNAQSTGIDVVANNLANLNTTGFKASVVSFHDLVTQSLGAGLGDTQVGFGVGRPVTLREFTQGALQTTSGPLDAAIQGDGFFIAQAANGQTLYTRGGNLQVNSAGSLVTATGETLQGWTEQGGVINTNAVIGNISVPVGSVKAPLPTSSFSFDINFNAAAAPGSSDASYSTSIQIYDTLGTSHIVTAAFTKDPTVAGQWNYSVSIPDGDLTNPPFAHSNGKCYFRFERKTAYARLHRPATAVAANWACGRCVGHDHQLEFV